MKLILFLSLMLTSLVGFAQVELEWVAQKKVSNLSDFKMNIDDNGNSFFSAVFMEGDKSMLEVTRYNPTGTLTWTRNYDSDALIVNGMEYDFKETPSSVIADKNGNIIITGTKSPYNPITMIRYQRLFTVKYSAAGDLLWERTFFDPSSVQSVGLLNVLDNAGNSYVAGTEYASNYNDFLIIKYDAGGEEIWAERYNGTQGGDDLPVALAVDKVGDLYITGTSMGPYPNGWDYLTIKYSSFGVMQWVARFNEDYSDYVRAIALDDSGNILVTGSSQKAKSTTNTDFLTVKYNPDGQQVWVQWYAGLGGSKVDEGTSIAVDHDGNVYVSGRSEGIVDSYDIILILYLKGIKNPGKRFLTGIFKNDGCNSSG